MIYLLKMIDPNLINMDLVHHGSNLDVFRVRNNLDLAFEGCKKVIRVIGIDAQTFLDKTPHLMLAILWQLVRKLQVSSVKRSIKRTASFRRADLTRKASEC